MDHPFHPLCELFPPMSEDAFSELVSDIKQNGLRYPIYKERSSGLIIDGRNRYLACLKAKVRPRYEIWNGKTEALLPLVISLNVKRRHLDVVQKVEVALKLIDTKPGEKMNQWTSSGRMTIKKAAVLLGISEDTLQRARSIEQNAVPQLRKIVKNHQMSFLQAAAIASMSSTEQRRLLQQSVTLKAVKHSENHHKRIMKRVEFQAQDLPSKTFDVLLVDPPWFYTDQTLALTLNPGHHYPTLKDEELAVLPVESVVNSDSMLFMWSTSLTLQRALNLMNIWGFEYLSSIVWVKTKDEVPDVKQGEKVEIALSHVFGNGPVLITHEFLLIGKRGKGLGKVHYQPRSVLLAQGGAGASKKVVHSRKPETPYDWIENMWPKTTKLELFSRNNREGWIHWGFETKKK